ncbi:2-(5''-triphosphoribosyl)-3'-dephosphocoenzyme-A synthase [Methylobacterium adhaesivum]|uniref:Triphosphoribosyl-dephospho-CoA synthase n=1 Tax=Methylobacterium adhaesivum TaxID=333297 RepID=A0ABT8BAX1_9HYPH|nr:triphosphoribosyl-dephospho-CoA synthase [Methylobacterium adhaesivum]MDN3589167.1 triphosphoribosyl-dephospho-CoA synthase [Methylobacterium adhaesivum]GJD33066.1 2-(5''-triphosphoribosyl)-3'-dephosphocoenzyme-A synthase [Methylobacterium adhaesivum]
MTDPAAIGAAYEASCLAELDALKPGNVHAFAAGHRMAVADFVISAKVSTPHLARAGARVGARVRSAMAATLAAVGQNTNLGILLLCAPLARAAEAGGDVAATLTDVLDTFDGQDAVDVYAAIRMANPGGLGTAARHDVTDEAAPPALRTAMTEAASRDAIAHAYGTGFAALFEIGLPALAAARAAGLTEPWTTTAVFIAYLGRVPDSHVARKHGLARAEALRDEAVALRDLDLATQPIDALLAKDAAWKAAGLNPGTSADFTVATLFLDRLRD